MLLRFCRLGSLLAVLVFVSACQRTTGNAIPTVTFNGQLYFVVSGDLFNLDRASLTKLGTPSQSSLSDQDGFIYALDGVDPAQAAVAFDGGHPVLLVGGALFRALPTNDPVGSDPLASAIPALCKYWRDPPSNCG